MYDAKVTRADPALFVILIDQSSSMGEKFFSSDGKDITLAHVAKYVTDNFLVEVLSKCIRGDEIFDYVNFAIIGYSTSIKSAMPKVDLSEFPISSQKLQESIIKRNEDMDGFQTRYEWIEAIASGKTSMMYALKKAKEIIEKWIPNHRNSRPPLLLNITDGMPTDDPELSLRWEQGTLGEIETLDIFNIARQIQELQTNDGNVLICNAHCSTEKVVEIIFPNNIDDIDDPFAELMFSLSSVVPKELSELAKTFGYHLLPGSRFFIFNATAHSVVVFFSFGSAASLHNIGARPLGHDPD